MSKTSRTTARPKPYETLRPILSDATLASIRRAARQYVQAGGSMFLTSNPSDHDQHIGNVAQALHGDDAAVFEEALEETAFSNVEDQWRLSNLAGVYVAAHSDAAFLFGAFVGLEIAALTFGQRATVPIAHVGRRKRGAR